MKTLLCRIYFFLVTEVQRWVIADVGFTAQWSIRAWACSDFLFHYHRSDSSLLSRLFLRFTRWLLQPQASSPHSRQEEVEMVVLTTSVPFISKAKAFPKLLSRLPHISLALIVSDALPTAEAARKPSANFPGTVSRERSESRGWKWWLN